MTARIALLIPLLIALLASACTVGVPPQVDLQATVDAAVQATQVAQAGATSTAVAMATQMHRAVAETLTAEAGSRIPTETPPVPPTATPSPTLPLTATATNTDTPRPTETPRPTATPIPPPPTPSVAPDTVARAYFLAIADGVVTGDFRLAYSYRSSASQARQSYATFRDGFRTTASVTVESVRTLSISRSTAQVYISVVAGDWVERGIQYRRFEYDYTLVNEAGAWRMERARVTTTELGTEPTPDDDEPSGVAAVDPVTAWNGLRLWESIGSRVLEVLPAGRQVDILGEPVSDAGTLWLQVRDRSSGRRGWVMQRYLMVGPVEANYYSLHWMPGCAPDRPEVELLGVNQSPCTPSAERWSLDLLADQLRGLGTLAVGEWLEPLANAGRPNWSIRVTDGSGTTRGWIRIGTAVPLPNHPNPSLVGGVWRTPSGSNALVGRVCWLRLGYEWRCEEN